jgi:CRISPR/Cas system endoribonuclease Cas6 (RAMP superfamily)
VLWFARRAGFARIDERLRQSAIKLAGAGLALAVVLWVCRGPAMNLFKEWHQFRDLAALVTLMAIGGGIYGAIVLAIFGRDWLKRFRAAAQR